MLILYSINKLQENLDLEDELWTHLRKKGKDLRCITCFYGRYLRTSPWLVVSLLKSKRLKALAVLFLGNILFTKPHWLTIVIRCQFFIHVWPKIPLNVLHHFTKMTSSYSLVIRKESATRDKAISCAWEVLKYGTVSLTRNKRLTFISHSVEIQLHSFPEKLRLNSPVLAT